MILYHLLVSVALALVVVGVVFFATDKTTNTTKVVLKVGAALLVLAFVLLVVWTHLSYRSRIADRNAAAFREGSWVSFLPSFSFERETTANSSSSSYGPASAS